MGLPLVGGGDGVAIETSSRHSTGMPSCYLTEKATVQLTKGVIGKQFKTLKLKSVSEFKLEF